MAETKELNLEQKVTVRSIAGWTTGFARRADGIGDITIAPNGSIRLSRNEIIPQTLSEQEFPCSHYILQNRTNFVKHFREYDLFS